MHIRDLSVLMLLSVVMQSAGAQDLPPMPTPEKEHEWLRQFVGEWSTTSKADMGPGTPPMVCEGSIQSRMIGDFWVQNEIRGEFGGFSMVGVQTIGYDPKKKAYVGTWVDSSGSYMWRYEGSLDDSGKVLTLDAEGPNFMAEGKMTQFQDVYEFKSADEMRILSKMQGEDGKWVTFMSGTAKRLKQPE